MAHEFLIFGLTWIEVRLTATPLEEIASKPKTLKFKDIKMFQAS